MPRIVRGAQFWEGSIKRINFNETLSTHDRVNYNLEFPQRVVNLLDLSRRPTVDTILPAYPFQSGGANCNGNKLCKHFFVH
jgi:hypothetical protein